MRPSSVAYVEAGAPAPSEAALVEAARSVVPGIAARRAETYARRQVPAATISELRDLGLFRLLQPRRFGGYESDFRTVMRCTEEIANGCPSTGWVFAVLVDHMWIMALYPEQAQLEVWGENPEALASSSFGPRATAARVPGGFRLSGKWSFSSGCDHAQWAILGAFCEGRDAHPVYNMLVPMSDIEIVDDWEVFGLNGTGSKSLILSDVFIPEYRAVSNASMTAGQTPGATVHPNYPLCRGPRTAFTVFTLAPVMISIARQVYELVVTPARTRVSRGTRIAHQQSVQLKIAEAGALIDIAATVIRARYEEAMERLETGAFPPEWVLSSHRDISYSTARLRQAVEMLCDLTGGSWLYDKDPVQQLLRDALAASSHRGVNWDNAGGNFGRYALGVD